MDHLNLCSVNIITRNSPLSSNRPVGETEMQLDQCICKGSPVCIWFNEFATNIISWNWYKLVRCLKFFKFRLCAFVSQGPVVD